MFQFQMYLAISAMLHHYRVLTKKLHHKPEQLHQIVLLKFGSILNFEYLNLHPLSLELGVYSEI